MAIIIKLLSCPYCSDKNYRSLAKHIKKEHKVSLETFFEDLYENGVLHQELCSNCHLKVDLGRLKKITFGQIVFYSYKNKITCSAHCSKSLSGKEAIKEHPEIKERFVLLNKSKKGKTYDEQFGKAKSDLIKNKISLKTAGKNNANFGGKYCKFDGVKKYARMNFEQRYGKEKALLVKNKLSEKFKGENNSMFGRPSPPGSGNGWKGWYKDFFFRSLLELSFLLENNLKNVESAEKSKYKITYFDYLGIKHSYFADFKIGNFLYECKPKSLWTAANNKLKFEAAKVFCQANNLVFIVIEPKKLSDDILLRLYSSGEIRFIDRYKKKFEERYLK